MRKISISRKSGYYWVGWNYTTDMSNIVYHIGYYDESMQRWCMLGDEGWYSDANFIRIDEIPITRKPRLPWYWQLLANIIAGLILTSLASGLLWIVVRFLDAINNK